MAAQIIDYSAKAIAVIGDTKPIKDALKAMGGRFNPKLTCGAGWIFSARKREEVAALLGAEPKRTEFVETRKNTVPKDWQLYVGTYAKYNNGSIEGAWLTLSDYANKAEFLAACRKLHKDESDPEFMFQDGSGVPSWLWGESFVSDEIWHYKPIKEAEVQSAAEKRAILEKYVKPVYLEDYIKATSVVLELQWGCFRISKPTIETSFCHPDEPEAEAAAWREACRTYEFFERENLDELDRAIEALNSKEAYLTADDNWYYMAGKKIVRVKTPYYGQKNEGAIELDAETRKKLIQAYTTARAAFKKRLQTWWKRYGADKLHCWTYWADR